MLTLIIVLAVLAVFFGIGFFITGALLSALVWVCIKLPIGLVLFMLGVVFCCTILLIPLGKILIKAGIKLMIPLV